MCRSSGLRNLVSGRIGVISRLLKNGTQWIFFIWMVLKSTPTTNPDALTPPFRSSVDQVYFEMARSYWPL